MKHTPGPWKVGNESIYSVDRYVKNAEWARIRGFNGALIAKVESVNPKGQRKSCDFDIEAANARLIAAAPEMLEALIDVHDIINSYSHIPAIAKACHKLQAASAAAEVKP